jgi:hypothetical protein
MAGVSYINGRKKYARPQAMLWADNPGTILTDEDSESPTYLQQFYVPLGFEIGSELNSSDSDIVDNEFIVLSDDNREPINFSTERIEERKRMVNGRMRSYHIADKVSISVSWNNLPSRAYSENPDFNILSGETNLSNSGFRVKDNDSYSTVPKKFFTSDGGAGGAELLEWYRNHPGSFWVFLSYDNHLNFGRQPNSYNNLNKYSEVIEMFFGDFEYSVEKRGASNHDLWNVSVQLEEV